MDSDEENELYEEVDRIAGAQENALSNDIDPEYESARLWNSVALQVVSIETAYQTIYSIFTPSVSQGKELDPEVPLNNIARALVMLGVKSYEVDLDRILDEVHKGVPHLQWVVSEGHYEWTGQGVRLSALIGASPSFRKCLVELQICEPLCRIISSPVSSLFTYPQLRVLTTGCKIVQKQQGDILFDGRPGVWTVLLEGAIEITRFKDDIEVSSCTVREGFIFGAYQALDNLNPRGLRTGFFGSDSIPSSGGVPRSNSGTTDLGQKGTDPSLVIKASETSVLIQMKIDKLEEVCAQWNKSHKKAKKITHLRDEMIEAPNRDISKLRAPYFGKLGKQTQLLTEVQRKGVRDSFALLDNLWAAIAMGANTVPRGSLDLVKEVNL